MAEPTEAVIDFPTQPGDLRPGSFEHERLGVWASQAKRGLITLCTMTEGRKRCYHPVNPVRDPSVGNEPLVMTDEDGKQYVQAICSFAGEAHGEQRIYPPKKEDEI